jgi:[ribosomal protein S5]-alanine N-acetyltransferase
MALSELCASPVALTMTTTTARLSLRAPRSSDLTAFASLQADPAVNRFCEGTAPATLDSSRAQLQAWIEHWDRHGFGHWAITERSDPAQLIGFGGLMRRSVGDHAGLYLYYRILPQVWGRGLASEMAQQALHLAFEQLDQPSVVAAVLPSNAPARKTLEGLGLRIRGALADVPGRTASLLYELSAAHWAGLSHEAPAAIPFAA